MAYAPLGQGRANEMFAEPIHAERIAENIDIFDFELNADEMSSLCSLDKAAPMIGKSETPELVESAMKWWMTRQTDKRNESIWANKEAMNECKAILK